MPVDWLKVRQSDAEPLPVDRRRPSSDGRGAAVYSDTGHVMAGRSPHLWTAAGVVALGSTASILSSTVVNVAVPDLRRIFASSITDVQWVLTAYLLGLAAVIPVSGYLSDRFGTRRLYLATIAAFTLASGLCGLAWSLGSEIFFRVIQGLAGGMVMPVGMTIVMRMAGPESRGRVMAILGIPMMLGPAFGPTVGGWLIQQFDWRWVFWVNLPAGVLALVFGYFLLQPAPPAPVKRLDWLGLLLATPGVTAILYGLTQAAETSWTSTRSLIPLAVGLTLVLAFVAWELRRAEPLLDMRVFRDAAFSGSATVGVVVAASLFGAVFLIPVFMQEVQGHDTLQAGLLLAPQGVGAALAMPISGILTDRIGAKPVVFTGILVLMAATLLLTAVTPDTPDRVWIMILGLRGVGMGFTMMPNFAAAYVTLPPAAIARATAVSNTLQRVSSSLGIALFATILTARLHAHPLVAPAGGRGAAIGGAALQHLARVNAAHAFDETFWFGVGVAALGLPAALLLRRPLPEGLAGSGTSRHPPLSSAARASAMLLLVAAVGFLAFTLEKTLGRL